MITTLPEILARIPEARQAIEGAVYRTPLEPSPWLSEISGATVFLKEEYWQPTGSFKVRGATAAVAHLTAEQRERGVVTASAGNHGLGLAYAASRLGVQATIVTPDNASPAKISALQRFPVRLLTGGPSYDDAERRALQLADESGAVFVSPYNDPWVVAGQGTIGVELLEDVPDLTTVLVPVGGGGLISGIGTWLKAVRPSIRVVGVQSSASPAMEQALAAGRLVEIPILPTIADGLAANIQPGSITFPLAQKAVDEMVLVSEEEIAETIAATFQEIHVALEGSAVVGIAALRTGKLPDKEGKIAVVVTGRNIAAERLCGILARG
ncbi:MAG TPA: threonine/serine dehydratase [Chloroflexota bacterium]|nr:threonine/serine dehydratase [Chloroflexota bacterium]